jgi:leishmanolysin-like peptidase
MKLNGILCVGILGCVICGPFKPWKRPISNPQNYQISNEDIHGRRLSTVSCTDSLSGRPWESIRIFPIYVDVDTDVTSEEKRNYVKSDLVPNGIKYLQNTLKVRRVQGSLRAKRDCLASFASGSLLGQCAQAASSTTCGTVDGVDIKVPTTFLDELVVKNSDGSVKTTLPAGVGAADADLILMVTVKPDASTCGDGVSGTIAYATSCQFDQCDRPVLGFINFCPNVS